MRIVFMGNNDRGVACLRALVRAGEQVVGVVAHPDRKTESWYGSVQGAALELGIEVIQPIRINEPEPVAKLRSWNPDLMVLVGYTQIIGAEILDLAPMGCLNLHGGRLPDYRGGSPLNWQIINDEPRIGLSIIFVDQGVDTGDIVAEAGFDLNDNDDINSVVGKSVALFAELLVGTVKDLKAGNLHSRKQSPEQGATWSKRYPRDGRILWDRMTARQVFNLVRALTAPYPGAFCRLADHKVFIWKCAMLKETFKGVPGRTVRVGPDGVVVVAADRGILVTELQLEGAEPLPAHKVLNRPGMDLT